MAKVVECALVNPASGCGHVIEGDSEEDLLRKAGEHAKQAHGMEPTPELMSAVKSHIKDA